jgi:hypothetical protein
MCDKRFSRQWSGRGAYLRFSTVSLFLAALATGCSTARPPPNLKADSILVEARFINIKGDPISVDNRPTDSSLALGVIAGAIGGTPSQTLQVVRIAKMSTIEIDAGAFNAAIIKQAATMSTHFSDSGLRIEPVDTRFARASTLLNYSGVLHGDLSVGFVDPDSKNSLTLVYFDRPCRLTGVITTGNEKLPLKYDVTVDKPGLNWLVRIPADRGGFVMSVANEPIRKMLVVAPVENRKNASFQIN